MEITKSLATYTRRYSLDNNLKPGPTPADFDNYLYDLAEKVWPHVIQLIEDNFSGAVRYLKWLLFFRGTWFRGNSLGINTASYIF